MLSWIAASRSGDSSSGLKTRWRSLLVLLALAAAWQSESAWPAPNASMRLASVIKQWESFERREFPEQATLRGQHDADERLTDVSDSAVLRRRQFVTVLLAQVRSIDPAALSEQQQLSRELLQRQLAQRVRLAALYGKLPFGVFYSDSWLPFSSLGGPHTTLVTLAQASRFDRRQDYENYIARLGQVPAYLRNLTKRMQVAIDAGWIGAAPPMLRIPDQLAGFASADIVSGPLMAPFSGPLRGVNEQEREELAARARQVLTQKVAPAFADLKRFFEEQYLPAARAVPLSASRLPAGEAYYDELVRFHTTTTETPQQIHEIGLSEVARIGGEIRRTLDAAGFSGKLSEYVAAMRADPAQRFESADAMLAGYRDIAKRADAELPALFATLPRMPYGIRAMEPFEGDNAEYYVPGSEDGLRPGYFMANVNRLDRRGRFEMEALLLHEAVPGHHLQIARALELRTIPEFRRNLWLTAYGEGWALYAESLGEQMGLYKHADAKIGYLSSAIWRAARLVVDTGLHRFDWTRQQAIDYLIDNAGLEPGMAAAEVDRYISLPGQALAYKMGELKIRALKQKAKARLGDRFDQRRFHNALLDDGPLPLDVLERTMKLWMERESAGKLDAAGHARAIQSRRR